MSRGVFVYGGRAGWVYFWPGSVAFALMPFCKLQVNIFSRYDCGFISAEQYDYP